jgi:hypothetical protein
MLIIFTSYFGTLNNIFLVNLDPPLSTKAVFRTYLSINRQNPVFGVMDFLSLTSRGFI